jgi:hypothetical protein
MATKKMQDTGKTGAQLKKEGMALKAKGQSLKMQGAAMKKVGQDQFLKKAEVTQDLINYRTRKGQIQDMNPEMLAKLKSRVNRAAEIKKERASKTYKTGGMVNSNAKISAIKTAGSKGVKSGVNPKVSASTTAKGRTGGTNKSVPRPTKG